MQLSLGSARGSLSGQSQGRRDEGADFGGKGLWGTTACLCIPSPSTTATTPAGSCGGFLYQYSPKEKGVTAPRPTSREGAKPIRVMAIQALLKAETSWGRGTVGQGWGQPQKLGLPPHRPGCALQTGFPESCRGRRKARCKREAVAFSAIQGHKNFPRRRFVLRTKAWYITVSSQSTAMDESFYFLSGAFILFLIADDSLDAFSSVSQCNRKTAPHCTVLS